MPLICLKSAHTVLYIIPLISLLFLNELIKTIAWTETFPMATTIIPAFSPKDLSAQSRSEKDDRIGVASQISSNEFSEIVFYGGGPSSVPGLALLLSKLNNEEQPARFGGQPSYSLIMRGRDPQKTLVSLAQVASKYKSFNTLLKETVLYYGYLNALAETFSASLSVAIETVYNDQTFNGFTLLYDRSSKRFMKAGKQGDAYIVNGVALERCGNGEFGQSLFCFPEGHRQQGRRFEYLSERHGDFHYLPQFFDKWEDEYNHMGAGDGEEAVVIDRAGFLYPDPKANQLMAELNVDFNLILQLSLMQRVDGQLNELQRRLLNLSKTYVKSSIYPQNKSLVGKESYIILGAGRAAGEVARRLCSDVEHSSSLKKLSRSRRENVSVDVPDEAETLRSKYRQILAKRRRSLHKVVSIDHRIRLVDGVEGKCLLSVAKTLARNKEYLNFLREVNKFGVCPAIYPEDLPRYQLLRDSLESLVEGNGDADSALLLSAVNSLLESQSKADSKFVLRSAISRHTETWEDGYWNELKKIAPGEPGLISIGGAQHACPVSPSPSSSSSKTKRRKIETTGGDSSKPVYQISRIQYSHYREENLSLLEAFKTENAILDSDLHCQL